MQARKSEGLAILSNWDAYRRYAEQGGLTYEALLIVCGVKERPLSQMEKAAKKRVDLYMDQAHIARSFYHNIRRTHRGWHFKRHPDYATYVAHRQARNKTAAEILDQAPLHREFVTKRFKQGVSWKALTAHAKQSRPPLPSPEMRKAVERYVETLQAARKGWAKLHSLTKKDASISQNLDYLRGSLSKQAQLLLQNRRHYHSFVLQYQDIGVHWNSIRAIAAPIKQDSEAPQRVVAYQRRVQKAREAWQTVLASEADSKTFQLQYEAFIQIQTERNRLARFLVERADVHRPWVQATRSSALPLTWSLIERHASQQRSRFTHDGLPAFEKGVHEDPIQAPLSPLALTLGLHDTFEALVEKLLGRPDQKNATTWMYGKDAQKWVVVAGTGKGQYRDLARGVAGGPIDLIASVLGCQRNKAMEWARTWLNQSRSLPVAHVKTRSTSVSKVSSSSRQHWVPAEQVSRELGHHSERLALQLLGTPTSMRGDQWRWGRKGSVSVYVKGEKQGLYSDFERGVHGNLLTLIQEYQGLSSKKEAFQWGLSFLGYSPSDPERERAQFAARAPELSERKTPVNLRPEWVPIYPVPTHVSAPDLAENPFLNKPLLDSGLREVARYTYQDAEGHLLGYAVRLEDADGQKSLRPLTYCENKSGKQHWRWKGFGDNRPLYGLSELARTPDRPVLLVEGEKTADAARQLFKAHTVVSWHGGTGAVKRVDWNPLIGKEVILWPDHDDPGRKAMDWIEGHVRDLNQQAGQKAKLRYVHLPKKWPEKWDLADPIPTGWGLENLHQWVKDAQERERGEGGGIFSGLTPLASSKKEAEVIIRVTLQAYQLEQPKTILEDTALQQIHRRYQELMQWQPKEARDSMSWQAQFSLKQKAILAEVVKPHLQDTWVVHTPLEAHHRVEQVALITADLIRSQSDKSVKMPQLVTLGNKLYHMRLDQQAQAMATYRTQYPEASEYQRRILADQHTLHQNAVGRSFTEAQRNEILSQAKALEAHRETLHRESQRLCQQETSFGKAETPSTMVQAIERQTLATHRAHDQSMGHQKHHEIDSLSHPIQRAIQETQQLRLQLETQRGLELQAHALARQVARTHDGGERDR